MTDRLYYHDCYLSDFEAHVIEAAGGGRRVYLDRTAFYPTSGGQPFDLGTLGSAEVVEVIDEGERIAHVLSSPLSETEVRGRIDWARRFDHMQQHTGQHLLSSVLVKLFDFTTLSFHLGVDSSNIEINAASLSEAQLDRAEEYANRMIWENRPVTISFEEQSAELGLRKASAREGILRIVAIDGLDRSACGGTHLRSTGEIGLLTLRKMEKIRGNVRIDFLCGLRALRRARADYRALSAIGRSFSSPIDETPALVEAQLARVNEIEKARRKLSIELAARDGRELYAATPADAEGFHRVIERAPITDETRAKATAFTAGPRSVFLAVSDDPPAILFTASQDSGINAGARLKEAVTALGGRGGGNATVAQGSVPDKAKLEQLLAALM
jgi:alanyl-tRNA synthetase